MVRSIVSGATPPSVMALFLADLFLDALASLELAQVGGSVSEWVIVSNSGQ